MKRRGVVTTSDEIETAYVTLDTQREEGKDPENELVSVHVLKILERQMF